MCTELLFNQLTKIIERLQWAQHCLTPYLLEHSKTHCWLKWHRAWGISSVRGSRGNSNVPPDLGNDYVHYGYVERKGHWKQQHLGKKLVLRENTSSQAQKILPSTDQKKELRKTSICREIDQSLFTTLSQWELRDSWGCGAAKGLSGQRP